MKRSGFLAALLLGAFGLVGCGDNDDSIQSPDFSPVLTAVGLGSDAAVDPNAPLGVDQRILAAGQSASLDVFGAFTTPPGTTDASGAPAPIQFVAITEPNFSVSQPDVASISDGRITGIQVGSIVTVTADSNGISSNPISFRIVSPVLLSLDVTPDALTISPFDTATFSASGTFSDGSVVPVAVNWSVSPAGVVTLSNLSNSQNTEATPVNGSNGLTATITATVNNAQGEPISDTASVSISNEIVTGLTGLRPINPTVAPGASIEFTAIGTFSDGTTTRTGDLSDSIVDWTSDDPVTVASIDTNTGIATGIAPGGQATTITATLSGAVAVAPGSPTAASTTLTVTDARCTDPLLAVQGATTSVSSDVLCIGCSVSNADNIIDGNANTFASLNAVLGLLLGSVTLNVDSAPAAIDFPGGQRAGFVVAQPPGLLSAELLSSLSLSTRNNGVVAEAAGAQTSNLLTVTALGAIGGQEAALISFVPALPFDGLALTFNSGVLSLLPGINAFQACGTAVDTTP